MRHELPQGFARPRSKLQVLISALGVVALGASTVAAGEAAPLAPVNGTIGYVLTDLYWSMYQTPQGKTECPKGLNDGPREQFAKLFPSNKARPMLDTQLKYEAETWNPTDAFKQLPFHLVEGPYSFGMNLDGQVGPEDFTHPEGEQGIDNQLYRALGCVIGFRGPDGVEFIYENMAIRTDRFNRMMIELSGVQDLRNDDDVIVTLYRGMDRLLTDATGNAVVPGGAQRIDTRWGASLMRQTRGRIVDGVLTTEPIGEVVLPWENLGAPSYQHIHDMRLRLKLTATGAEGLIAGYADVQAWYHFLLRNDSTHHLGDGQISAVSLYQALRRLADAYPDPATGANTAISSSLDAKFTQVFIEHPQGAAAKAELLRSLTERFAKSKTNEPQGGSAAAR